LARAKPQRDERQVGNDDEGHPVPCHEHTARNIDTDLRSRTSSGPADIVSAQPGRTYDRKPPSRSKRREKTLANPGRPHMARRGSPPLPGSPSRRAVPTTPADRMGAFIDCFPIRAAFPVLQVVGIRISTFEAGSGFTHVTARRFAQPPKAAFVTRLRYSQLPNQTARQLPEQSTILWVEPPSTELILAEKTIAHRRSALRLGNIGSAPPSRRPRYPRS